MNKAATTESLNGFDNSFDKSAMYAKEKNSESAGHNAVSAWKEMEKDFSQKKALLGDKSSQSNNSNDNELYFSDPFKSNKDDKAVYLKKNDAAKNGGAGATVEGDLQFSPDKQKNVDGGMKDKVAVDKTPSQDGGLKDKFAVEKIPSQDGGLKDKVAIDKTPSLNDSAKGKTKDNNDEMFVKPVPKTKYYEQLL